MWSRCAAIPPRRTNAEMPRFIVCGVYSGGLRSNRRCPRKSPGELLSSHAYKKGIEEMKVNRCSLECPTISESVLVAGQLSHSSVVGGRENSTILTRHLSNH
jgi:ribosomal protein S27AE